MITGHCGRLLRETTTGDDAVARSTEYEYDNNSNLVRLRYPMVTNSYARWDYDLGSGDNTDADDAYRVAFEFTKGVTYHEVVKASSRYPFGPLAQVWFGNNTNSPRRAMHGYFCQRDLPQQLDQRRYIRPETYARLPEAARYLLDV